MYPEGHTGTTSVTERRPPPTQSPTRCDPPNPSLSLRHSIPIAKAAVPSMIRITPTIALDERAIEETFIRASGPGGQNVNKVSTAVQLRLDLNRTDLPHAVRARLEKLAGKRLTLDGDLLITAQRHRTQDRNRTEAMETLIQLIQRAAIAPIRRIATKPTAGSRQRRLEAKAHRARTKQHRGGVGGPD